MSLKLLSVEDARARMLAEITAAPAETVPLAQAAGRVLAEQVTAIRDQPPFDASAMDGWAVRAADTPATLAITGESAAGHGFAGAMGAGQAVRIFTGAAMPEGGDAVVIQENAERLGEAVRVPQAARGDNVRLAGGDFRAGDQLLPAGVRLDPWRLMLAASAGRAELRVHRRPRVAILSTGEEIVDPPAVPGRFQIYNSGSPALAAMIAGWGGLPVTTRPVGDTLEAVTAALREAEADLVVTLGGASVGDHDLVRAGAAALGLSLKVASVAVRPGKPTFFGVLGDGRRMLGLPGNPASAFVCAELFLRPILMAWQGADPAVRTVTVRAAQPLAANGPREHWMRAKLAWTELGPTAAPFRDQDSSLVSVFAVSDALLRRGPDAPSAAAGDPVEVLLLPRA